MVILVSDVRYAVAILHIYTLPTLNLAVNLYKSFHTVIFVTDVTRLHISYLKPGYQSE